MQSTHRRVHRVLLSAASGYLAVMLLLGSTAQAAPLNLELNLSPDILSIFVAVDYNATADTFTASGFATQLKDATPPVKPIAGGAFGLTASIDSSGNLSGGSLTINGTIAGLGFNSGTLLTGSLTDFGFLAAGGNPLEFLFTVSGGDAAVLFGGVNATGGVIMGNTGFGGSFANDFGADAAFVNVGEVPLPAAAWLFGSGLAALVGAGLRRRTGTTGTRQYQ